MFNTTRLIKTEQEYEAALARTHTLIRAQVDENTSEFEELGVLLVFIEKYEQEHYPIHIPESPIEAIKFRIEQLGLTEAEINKIFGSRERKEQILNGERKLTLPLMRLLHNKLKVPAESLLVAY